MVETLRTDEAFARRHKDIWRGQETRRDDSEVRDPDPAGKQ